MIHKGPERVVELIERIYYRCRVPEHRHPEPHNAVACMKKAAAAEARPPKTNWTPERFQELIKQIESGMTYAEIGALMGNKGAGLGERLYQEIARRNPCPVGMTFMTWYADVKAKCAEIVAAGRVARKAKDSRSD